MSGAASRASATREYALTSWAVRNASRVVLRKSPSSASFGVKHEIHVICLAADLLEKLRDVFVLRDVTRPERRPFPEFAYQFLDIFFQSFALVIEDKARAGVMPASPSRPAAPNTSSRSG